MLKFLFSEYYLLFYLLIITHSENLPKHTHIVYHHVQSWEILELPFQFVIEKQPF